MLLNPFRPSNAYMRQKTNHHWFRHWLVAWTAPSHFLNQFWNIVNWNLRNKLQWNLNRTSYIFIQENAFKKCMSSRIWRPFCLGINVFLVLSMQQLIIRIIRTELSIVRLRCTPLTGLEIHGLYVSFTAWTWTWLWIMKAINIDMTALYVLILPSPSPLCAAYMRQWTGWALVQIMACRLFGAKPLPEPMLIYCQFDPQEYLQWYFVI